MPALLPGYECLGAALRLLRPAKTAGPCTGDSSRGPCRRGATRWISESRAAVAQTQPFLRATAPTGDAFMSLQRGVAQSRQLKSLIDDEGHDLRFGVRDAGADTIRERSGAPCVLRKQILGGGFRFESASAPLLDLVETAYGDLPRHRLPATTSGFRVELRLLSRQVAPGAVDTPPRWTQSDASLLCSVLDASNYAVLAPGTHHALVAEWEWLTGASVAADSEPMVPSNKETRTTGRLLMQGALTCLKTMRTWGPDEPQFSADHVRHSDAADSIGDGTRGPATGFPRRGAGPRLCQPAVPTVPE